MNRRRLKPRFRLRKLRITNIDRVEAGANPGARALIYKSADTQEELDTSASPRVEWLGIDDAPNLTERDGELVYQVPETLRPLGKAAATKRDNGEDFPAAAYAYVPDPTKSSTWKLRLWNTLESKETRPQIGAALAALSRGGFRGERVQIPSADMAGVKRKIMAAWLKTHADQSRADAPAVLKASGDTGVETMSEIQLGDLDPEVATYINELQGQLDSAVAVTAELDAMRAEDPDALAELLGMELVTKSEDEEEEDILKGADPELVQRIQKAETELAEMRYRDERQHYVEIAKNDLGGLAEPADAVGEALHAVAESVGEGSDTYKLVERVLKAASATAIQSADVLFAESGTSQGAFQGSAEAEINTKVEQVMKSKEVDFASAFQTVRQEDPELLRIYEQERADRARR